MWRNSFDFNYLIYLKYPCLLVAQHFLLLCKQTWTIRNSAVWSLWEVKHISKEGKVSDWTGSV